MNDDMIKQVAQQQSAVMEQAASAQHVQSHSESLEQHAIDQQAAMKSSAQDFNNDLDRHADRLSESLKEADGPDAAIELAEQIRQDTQDVVFDAADQANRLIREVLSQFAGKDSAEQQQGFDRVDAAVQLAQNYALEVDERSRTLCSNIDRAVDGGASKDQLTEILGEALDDLQRMKEAFDRSLEQITRQNKEAPDAESMRRVADEIAADKTDLLNNVNQDRALSPNDDRRRSMDDASERGESQTARVSSEIQDREFSKNASIRQLWDDAVRAARNTPDLSTAESARQAYDNTMKRFLTRLMGESPEAVAARKIFEDSGFKFLTKDDGELKKTLPWLNVPDVENGIDARKHADLLRVSGQHLKSIEDAPELALAPSNIAWMIGRDNIHMDANTPHARSIRSKTVDQISGSPDDNLDHAHPDVESAEEQGRNELLEETRLNQEREEQIREAERIANERDGEEREHRRHEEERAAEERNRTRQQEERQERERLAEERAQRQQEEARTAEERRKADGQNR
jgi:hypothetical protein